jgi:hypothetical protein
MILTAIMLPATPISAEYSFPEQGNHHLAGFSNAPRDETERQYSFDIFGFSCKTSD